MEEYVIRFVAGGIAVSTFAALGDVFRPKSFAGLFGAAPSIAIATLFITVFKQGAGYVALEGRSMMCGAIALAFYSGITCQLMKRFQLSGLTSTALAGVGWLVFTFGLDAHNGVAHFPARRLVKLREHLFKAVDLLFGFSLMLFERRFQLGGSRGFRHLRQG